MRYIVTGGAGPGSEPCRHLSTAPRRRHHRQPRHRAGREKIEHLLDHPRVTFIEGSITDLDLLMEVFPGADGILAGTPGAPVGEGSPCLERGERDRDTQCTRRGERLQDAGRGCGILGLR